LCGWGVVVPPAQVPASFTGFWGAGGGWAPWGDPPRPAAARAVFQATGRFHDPCYAREWTVPGVDEEFTAVVDLLIRGLSSPSR
ncbi:hypothetical protein ABT288_35540, partial [Streptomyces sp. NPDC001093]